MTQDRQKMNKKGIDFWDPNIYLILGSMLIAIAIISWAILENRSDNKYCNGQDFERVNHEFYNCCYEQEVCMSNDYGGCYWTTEKTCNGRRFKK